MIFERLESDSSLEVAYEGARLDLYALGVVHINLQEIIDKVAYWSLSQEGILEPTWRRPKYLPPRFTRASPRLVRAELESIRLGSLFETIMFSVASVLADPNTIAILNNLAANTIWAAGLSGIRGVRQRWNQRQQPPDVPPLRRENDPFDVGPNLRDMMLAVSENNNAPSVLKLSCKRTKTTETLEVEIQITGGR
jgi:hypothetical protein